MNQPGDVLTRQLGHTHRGLVLSRTRPEVREAALEWLAAHPSGMPDVDDCWREALTGDSAFSRFLQGAGSQTPGAALFRCGAWSAHTPSRISGDGQCPCSVEGGSGRRPAERLDALLAEYDQPRDAEREARFQNSLAWLRREVASTPAS
ncbi:MAG: hypothetical protein AB1938_24700 [Myxococcota bacterium]